MRPVSGTDGVNASPDRATALKNEIVDQMRAWIRTEPKTREDLDVAHAVLTSFTTRAASLPPTQPAYRENAREPFRESLEVCAAFLDGCDGRLRAKEKELAGYTFSLSTLEHSVAGEGVRKRSLGLSATFAVLAAPVTAMAASAGAGWTSVLAGASVSLLGVAAGLGLAKSEIALHRSNIEQLSMFRASADNTQADLREAADQLSSL